MSDLNADEMRTIGQCLKAVAYGPFLADPGVSDMWWEFHALIGLTRSEVVRIAEAWPPPISAQRTSAWLSATR